MDSFVNVLEFLAPLRLGFGLGNKQKSQRAKSGEYGEWKTTAIFLDAKYSCMESTEYQHDLYFHASGLLRRTSSLNLSSTRL